MDSGRNHCRKSFDTRPRKILDTYNRAVRVFKMSSCSATPALYLRSLDIVLQLADQQSSIGRCSARHLNYENRALDDSITRRGMNHPCSGSTLEPEASTSKSLCH